MYEVRVPKFGMSTVEVDIVEILVEVGQTVAVGDPIAEVDTEKVSMTMESDGAGTVTEIRVADGDVAQVGDVICVLS
jgi:YD repeat-containing protein